MTNTRQKRDVMAKRGDAARKSSAYEAGRPETVRVRMTVDLVGPLADELQKTAEQLGKSKTEVVREGLGYVFRALKARNDGYLVGAWKEEADGRVSRSREFVIGN